jgi:hypothetical protein
VEFVVFPEHVLLIVHERLREQEAEGVSMPEGMPLEEQALRILLATHSRGRGGSMAIIGNLVTSDHRRGA